MPSQNELRTTITAQIVDALTGGGLPPWRQPWKAYRNCGTPANVASKRNSPIRNEGVRNFGRSRLTPHRERKRRDDRQSATLCQSACQQPSIP